MFDETFEHRPAILTVDDDFGDRKHIRKLISWAGIDCDIFEAGTVEEVFTMSDRTPSMILLDFSMPGSDGLTLLEPIAARWPATAIVMVTGQGDELVASEALKQGAIDYIPKRALNEHSIRRVIENGMEMMRLRSKVAKQNAELERFAYVLAHDLKAPIRAVRFFIETAAKSIAEERYCDATKEIAEIGDYAGRIGNLIDCLTRHLQVESSFQSGEVSAADCVADAIANLRVDIDDRAIKIQVASLPRIVGDRTLITQLLQNLIANAIKFSNGQDPIVEVSSEDMHGGQVVLSVADNGIGIPADKAEQIFEPFKRLHSADSYPGAGLGLATCRKIVDLHSGRIWCEPRQGRGTEFRIALHKAS